MGDRSTQTVAARFRAGYGAPLWHLLVLVGCFAVTGWVVLRLADETTAVRMLIWFVAAVIVHDLVMWPVYAAADRALLTATRSTTATQAATGNGSRPARLSVVNHVRVPALGSALLFVVYLPGILQLGGGTFTAATGLTQQPYLTRWLLASAAMFAVSGLWLAVRLYRVRSRDRR
ncbi:hypothetical protein [Solwaraspora sp. WMMD792]|uniref:hypothetical protein n=1 Tax=Solwaraspora sp. WMMD792 TaxID=3016099 RepID=UPI002417B060|nr:hypothetical protein [Solwaraspora sp. WMMD792]MDG4772864.1 hypothetical protein [Solwaraspora sp. WMMD792]